jgi:hypothetical protein
MNYLKYEFRAFLACAAVITLVSCTKNFEAVNTPPKDPTTASTPQVYNMIISSLPQTAGEQSVYNSWIYPITQQAIVTSGAYPYDNARNPVWENYYLTMANYRLLESRIAESGTSGTMNNFYAMLKTIMAYKTFKVTNLYGDMPYSKAGYAPLKGPEGYKAVYDKQPDIYASLLTDFKWAVDNFKNDPSQYSVGTYETFLGNDIAKWIQFANSLRLYVAVTMYDKSTALAGAAITEALSKPLLSDDNNVGLWPAKIPGLEFQWREWSFSANNYLRMGSTMWRMMSSNNNPDGSGIFDPRVKLFFETNNAGQWAAYPQNPTTSTPTEGGAPYNVLKRKASWADKGVATIYSPVNVYFAIDIKTIPELMLTAAQVHFLKAEAYNRGLGVAANAATAEAEYIAGITASLNMWKSIAFNSPEWVVNKPASPTATAGELATLLASPVVKYDAANQANALKQIYAQLWIDQFRQPWDAWLLLRRTGGKTPMSTDNTSYYMNNFGKYNRFVYPDNEASYNTENWKTVTGSNDLNTTKIWITQ